ncbi:hypothetical protein [Microlunatus antarcticus]|uniref:Uncharacterized protein n=1 Tax=Microlunatus antarcticus TaxID=53388 RepID=A0A7W5JXV1_9ACTN|nr:hypothetical protein [Microlunatus antarcticus]MBB3328180.1 hypothetical protein [Microlunatus antarcticus]
MHELIAWSGFVGAWLLVAGPLYQAAVELDEQGERRGGVTRAARQTAPQPPLSPWWWLLPPVAYLLQRRRQRAYRRQVLDALTAEEVEGFVEFTSVATGWAMVAAGAFFIAVKETYELAEVYVWPVGVFALLLVVMLAACAANTVVRVRRAHALVEAKAAAPSDRAADPA